MLLAATHPSKVDGLVLFGASPSWARSDELPDEWSAERWDTQHRGWARRTNATEFADGYIRSAAPSLFGDETAKRALAGLFLNTAGLGAGSTPVADVQRGRPARRPAFDRGSDVGHPQEGRRDDGRLERALPGRARAAREYLEIVGRDSLPWIEDGSQPVWRCPAVHGRGAIGLLRPIGARRASCSRTSLIRRRVRRRSVTRDGQRSWRIAPSSRAGGARRARGTEIDTAGDGFFATFDGPAQAVQCAVAIGRATADLGISVRVGVHTGEVETIEGKPGGAAVIVGARVAATAGRDQCSSPRR